jgi:hypothetical protein
MISEWNVIRFPSGRSLPPTPTVDALMGELAAVELELARARLAQIRLETRQASMLWTWYCLKRIVFWGFALWLLATLIAPAKAAEPEGPYKSKRVEMPKQLRGVWCHASPKPYYIRVTSYRKWLRGATRVLRNCGEPHRITREGLFWEENACKPYSISTDGAWIKAKFKCDGVEIDEESYKVKNGRLYTR